MKFYRKRNPNRHGVGSPDPEIEKSDLRPGLIAWMQLDGARERVQVVWDASSRQFVSYSEYLKLREERKSWNRENLSLKPQRGCVLYDRSARAGFERIAS